MNRLTKYLILLLFLGLALSEVHGLVFYFFPQTETKQYKAFLDPEYKEQITLLWYIYEMAQIANRLIWALALTQIVSLISHRLFRVGVVFMIYYSAQLLFYVYNRNTSFLSNYILYACMIMILINVFISEKSPGKYRSIV